MSDDWNKLKHLVDLSAENARLKAEVERLKMEESKLLTLCETYEGDLERLRASSFVTAVPVEEYEKLKAEVERLRKAGDAMAEAMWYGDAERSIWVKKFAETDWNAAKEGKPHA